MTYPGFIKHDQSHHSEVNVPVTCCNFCDKVFYDSNPDQLQKMKQNHISYMHSDCEEYENAFKYLSAESIQNPIDITENEVSFFLQIMVLEI